MGRRLYETFTRWEHLRFEVANWLIGTHNFDKFGDWFRRPGCPFCKKPLTPENRSELDVTPADSPIPFKVSACARCVANGWTVDDLEAGIHD